MTGISQPCDSTGSYPDFAFPLASVGPGTPIPTELRLLASPHTHSTEGRFSVQFDPNGIAVLPEGLQLFIGLTDRSGVAWDFDDNLCETDPWVHSNPTPGVGRYATLISEMVKHPETGASRYQESDWATFQFSKCLGMETGYDLRRLIPAVNSAYSGVDLQCSDAYQLIHSVHERLLGLWQKEVHPVPGAMEAVNRCAETGLPMAIASAGPGLVVRGLLQHHRMEGKFQAFVTDTPKKTPDGYVGDAAQRACKEIGIEPANAILIGDSVSDVMTAAHAGVCCVIIRVPGKDFSARQATISRYVDELRRQNELAGKELVGPSGTKVIFIHHFDQASFERTRNDAIGFEAREISSAHRHDANFGGRFGAVEVPLDVTTHEGEREAQ